MKIKYLSVLPIIAVIVLSGISLAHAQSDVFTQNLYYGLQNNSQVTQLQEFLTSQGLYSGPITGNFYFLTMNAVKAFQAQQDITPAAGYFGPITMAAANKIANTEVGASNTQAISETGTSTPPAQTSSTMQLQLEALLQEVALLEQQLQAQQSSTQAIQNLQAQVQQQGQTLQQIASSTQAIASTTPQPSQPQVPTPSPTVSITANGSTPMPSTTSAPVTLGKVQLNTNQFYAGVRNNVSILLFDQNGNPITTASATITTDDPISSGIGWGNNGITETNNATGTTFLINQPTVSYAGDCPGNACGITSNNPIYIDRESMILGKQTAYYYYHFSYAPQTVGQHTITVSALGSTQSVTITSTIEPMPQVIVSLDSESASAPAAGNIPVGTSDNPLAIFQFKASDLEAARITDLTITDAVTSIGTSTLPGFSNLQLWYGSTLVSTADSAIPVSGMASTYTYKFHIANQLGIPQANSLELTLRGDATSPGSSNVFSIANASSVTALGMSDNLQAGITIAGATSNPQTVISQ